MITHFVIDVDGVLTDGKFYYTAEGKIAKAFGAHDWDGLDLLRDSVDIRFVSADRRGADITRRRLEDAGYGDRFEIVGARERLAYCSQFGLENVAYMGDGYYDAIAISQVAMGITPANGRQECKSVARYITQSRGGEGAVLDACLYIRETNAYEEADRLAYTKA